MRMATGGDVRSGIEMEMENRRAARREGDLVASG